MAYLLALGAWAPLLSLAEEPQGNLPKSNVTQNNLTRSDVAQTDVTQNIITDQEDPETCVTIDDGIFSEETGGVAGKRVIKLCLLPELSYHLHYKFFLADALDLDEHTLPEIDLSGEVGLKLSLDSGYLDPSHQAQEDRVDGYTDGVNSTLRKARVFTLGRWNYFGELDYKFEFAFERDDFFLNDFFVRRHFTGLLRSIRVGWFDPPFGLEALSASDGRAFLENSLSTVAFAPGIRPGIEALSVVSEPEMRVLAALTGVGQRQNTGDASSSTLRATGRTVLLPVLETETSEPTILHLGLGVSAMFADNDSVRYRARPESFLASFMADTGEVESKGSLLVGGELAYMLGPLMFQSELMNSFVLENSATESSATDDEEIMQFRGGHISASYLLTGESRGYNEERATFQLVSPNNKGWFAGGSGLGAVELASRASWVDLNSRSVQGRELVSFAEGLNVYLSEHTRVMFEFVYTDSIDEVRSDSLRTLQTRLEFRL